MATFNTVSTLIDTNLMDSSNITAADHRAVEQAILAFARDQWLTGDIKEIDCTQAYIDDTSNFVQSGDEKGKGTVGGPREGWAICNGNNGTKDRTGRVSVGYGTVQPPGINGIQTYPTVGDVGGSKDAVVVSHTHPTTPNTAIEYGTGINAPQRARSAPSGVGQAIDVTVGSTGESGIGKNMQPYIVTLFIQKL